MEDSASPRSPNELESCDSASSTAYPLNSEAKLCRFIISYPSATGEIYLSSIFDTQRALIVMSSKCKITQDYHEVIISLRQMQMSGYGY